MYEVEVSCVDKIPSLIIQQIVYFCFVFYGMIDLWKTH
jgi:hypothetical protein